MFDEVPAVTAEIPLERSGKSDLFRKVFPEQSRQSGTSGIGFILCPGRLLFREFFTAEGADGNGFENRIFQDE